MRKFLFFLALSILILFSNCYLSPKIDALEEEHLSIVEAEAELIEGCVVDKSSDVTMTLNISWLTVLVDDEKVLLEVDGDFYANTSVGDSINLYRYDEVISYNISELARQTSPILGIYTALFVFGGCCVSLFFLVLSFVTRERGTVC